MNNVGVVYTPWANLKKTGDMDVGQIGFHRQKDVSDRLFHGFTPSLSSRGWAWVDLHDSWLMRRSRP